MPKKTIVTVVMPGDDYTDCLACEFLDHHAALTYACDCAEAIDKTGWDDAIINNDGRIVAALNDFNEKQRFDNSNGLMGQACISLSSVYNRRAILAACKGENDWYKQVEDTNATD